MLGFLASLILAGAAASQPRPEPVVPCVRMWKERSSYEVWQNLEVDRFGRFRPLVIYSECGAYYRYNSMSYPWTSLHPLFVSPKIMN